MLRIVPAKRRVCAAFLLPLALVACSDSGGGSDDTDYAPAAFAVIGQAGFAGAEANRGGAAGANTLAQPQNAVAVAADGTVYVADSGNSRILGWYTLPMNDEPADFVIGQADFSSSLPGTAADRLSLPSSVSISEDGQFVVADSGNNRVLIWNTPPNANTPADVIVGQASSDTSDSGLSASSLANPTGAMISNGRLVVVDQANHRVLIWTSVPAAHGTSANVVLGQADFASDETGSAADEMDTPTGVWTDGFRLLIADTGNHRVLYWTQLPRANSVQASYVLGQTDFNRSVSGTSQAALRAPTAISSDGVRIYIADSGNNRVVRLNAFPILNGDSFDALFGQADYSVSLVNDSDQDGETDDTPSSRTLDTPTGVLIHDGVLYVSDRNSHRVLLHQP